MKAQEINSISDLVVYLSEQAISNGGGSITIDTDYIYLEAHSIVDTDDAYWNAFEILVAQQPNEDGEEIDKYSAADETMITNMVLELINEEIIKRNQI